MHPGGHSNTYSNTYSNNHSNNHSGSGSGSGSAGGGHNSFHKSELARIYSTETAEEPQWRVRERRRENDPDATSPRSCDNTINTSTESKYDEEELEAAIGE
jgi:hypothetical protein